MADRHREAWCAVLFLSGLCIFCAAGPYVCRFGGRESRLNEEVFLCCHVSERVWPLLRLLPLCPKYRAGCCMPFCGLHCDLHYFARDVGGYAVIEDAISFFGQHAPLIVAAMLSLSCPAASSVSLEGKNIWILQSVPLPFFRMDGIRPSCTGFSDCHSEWYCGGGAGILLCVSGLLHRKVCQTKII